MAITFGMQLTRVKGSEMEKRFASLVKGLFVYGSATVKSTALGDLRAIV